VPTRGEVIWRPAIVQFRRWRAPARTPVNISGLNESVCASFIHRFRLAAPVHTGKEMARANGFGSRSGLQDPLCGSRAWQASVGRVRLYLLDSNDPVNAPVLRGVTSELYGGGKELRLEQELVLGIGGWRLLRHRSQTGSLPSERRPRGFCRTRTRK